MKKRTQILIIISLLFFSCKSMEEKDPTEFQAAPLFGMIYDQSSTPVAGAEVILDGGKSFFSDINGRILLDEVSRGKHSIIIKKEGFEELEISFNFLNPGQILYSSLISLESILDKMESSLKEDKLSEAGIFNKRASLIKADDIRLSYLKVVCFIKTGDYKKALEEIDLLQTSHPNNPYLVMTRAKILFYGFGKKEEALSILTDFQTLNRKDELNELIKTFNMESR